MKKKIIIIATVLAVVIAASVTITAIACNSNNKKNEDAYTVYSVSNNVKVMREEDYADKGPAVLNFELAKNEVEGAQIIINSKEDTTFNATVDGDLISAKGNRIFAKNVAVYAQHYVKVEIATTSFPLGYYPDAIVPMANYLAARDNKIGKGNNQGIYVTVQTGEQTPADTYTGNLKLVVGNEVENIPITVEVWDFALPVATHTKTAFALWESQIFPEELDVSEEMLETYYEFFLDRRVASSYLPTYVSDNMSEYVELVKEYTLREDVPCFRLYFKTVYSDELSGWVLDLKHFESLIRSLIENSTAELDLMSKPYMYCSAVDEPQGAAAFERVKYINDNIYEIINRLANEYSVNGFFNDKPQVLESLLNFENVITTYYRDQYEDYVDTWCPTVNRYNSEEYFYNSLEQKENGHGAWWYTCMQPKYPQPSYHVDDYLLSGRTLSWMQMKYGITGNLYWATTIYKKYTNGGYVARDLWTDPLSFATKDGANGDGYLVYPGRKYGVKGPISTLRLESIREGMEDYEYLYLLRDILKEKGAKFNLNVDINDYIENLYSMLFSGTITNFKHDNIAFARREIASLITQLSKEDSPLIVVRGINGKTSKATAEIYANAQSIEVNGVAISNGVSVGEGKKFVASIPLNGDVNYANVKANGKEYSRFVSARVLGLVNFDDESECLRASGSQFTSGSNDTVPSLNVDRSFIQAGLGSLRINVKPAGNSSYTRTVSIDVTQNGSYVDFSSVRSISFTAYAKMPKNCNIFITLVDKNGMSYGVGSFYLQSEVLKTVKMGVMNVGSIDFKNIAKIEIEFPEIRSSTGYEQAFDLYLDNLFVENEIK